MLYITDQYKISDKFKKDENQDVCFSLTSESVPSQTSKMCIHCVLDGVSSANGTVASSLAQRVMQPILAGLIVSSTELADASLEERKSAIYGTMKAAVLQADAALRSHTLLNSVDTACTASIAVVFDEIVYSCNVGDSPIYLLRSNMQGEDHTLIPLFQSHNSAGLRLAQGLISKEEALVSGEKNHLVRFLGGKTVLDEMHLYFSHEYLGLDNVLLVGSDGALSVFAEEELLSLTLSEKASMKLFSNNLYDAVYRTDAKDNFTVIATHLELG